MKTLYLIGGTMGVGKTAISQQLKKDLPNSVFLDGDWCWDADPFQVTEETKEMVMQNICCLLNNFLHCTAYENIVFLLGDARATDYRRNNRRTGYKQMQDSQNLSAG